MRKPQKHVKMAAICILSIAMLAGCRELPGKADVDNQLKESFTNETGVESSSEDLQQQIETAVTDVGTSLGEAASSLGEQIADTAVNVSQSLSAGAVAIVDQTLSSGLKKELTATLQDDSITTLHLDNAVGEIAVTAGTGSSIIVKSTIIVHNEADINFDPDILDKAEVTAKTKDDTLTITTSSREKPNKDLWGWAEHAYGFSDFSINYEIEVPSSVDRFEISTDVGAIALRGLEGTFEVSSDVGAISLQGAAVTGKSAISTDTGNIDLAIEAMHDGSRLQAKSSVGRIAATLADDMQVTVETKSELGRITGVKSGKQDINGGGPLLKLSTEIGGIAVSP